MAMSFFPLIGLPLVSAGNLALESLCRISPLLVMIDLKLGVNDRLDEWHV